MVAAQSNRNAPLQRCAMLETLREVLAQGGLHESRSAEQEGIFLVPEGRDEVLLQYNGGECAAKAEIFRCCSLLTERRYAVTLVSSPRVLALYIRSETGC